MFSVLYESQRERDRLHSGWLAQCLVLCESQRERLHSDWQAQCLVSYMKARERETDYTVAGKLSV